MFAILIVIFLEYYLYNWTFLKRVCCMCAYKYVIYFSERNKQPREDVCLFSNSDNNADF